VITTIATTEAAHTKSTLSNWDSLSGVIRSSVEGAIGARVCGRGAISTTTEEVDARMLGETNEGGSSFVGAGAAIGTEAGAGTEVGADADAGVDADADADADAGADVEASAGLTAGVGIVSGEEGVSSNAEM
jgi:hypothetical protein